MTLVECKELLTENSISFEVCEFENETAYYHHTTQFPNTKNAKDCKVIVLIILSKNEKKNIELQFNSTGNEFIFEELRFGDYAFEMFDYNEEMLADDLLNHIMEIQSGNFVVITSTDLKKRNGHGDVSFDLNDDDDIFGRPAFEKAMELIQKPKGLISRLLKIQMQYEIFDWNTYQCIVK